MLYGIVKQLKIYSQQIKQYSVVFLSKTAFCAQQIAKLVKHCNVYVLIQGVFQATIKQAEKANEQLCNVALIYDTNNLFRVVNDIFETQGDHLILFDDQCIQVATDFDVKMLPKIIENRDKVKAELIKGEEEVANEMKINDLE
jgi:hypothetical protein